MLTCIIKLKIKVESSQTKCLSDKTVVVGSEWRHREMMTMLAKRADAVAAVVTALVTVVVYPIAVAFVAVARTLFTLSVAALGA